MGKEHTHTYTKKKKKKAWNEKQIMSSAVIDVYVVDKNTGLALSHLDLNSGTVYQFCDLRQVT